MAYTYCENCGEKIDVAGKFCPYCGHSKDGSAAFDNGSAQRDRENNGNEYGDATGGYGRGDGNGPYRTPYGGAGGGSPLYRIPMPQGNRRVGRLNTVVMIFSVAVVMFFNMICGIVAIGMALSAPNQPTQELEDKKNKNAMIANIIGIVLACATRVAMYFAWGQ